MWLHHISPCLSFLCQLQPILHAHSFKFSYSLPKSTSSRWTFSISNFFPYQFYGSFVRMSTKMSRKLESSGLYFFYNAFSSLIIFLCCLVIPSIVGPRNVYRIFQYKRTMCISYCSNYKVECSEWKFAFTIKEPIKVSKIVVDFL